MVAAFIVLTIVAVAIGAYIVYDIVHALKKTVTATPVSASEEISHQTEVPAEEEMSGEAGEVTAPEPEVAAASAPEQNRPRYIVIKYNRSFTAKLIQSDEQTKRYYTELKNELLGYDGVKSRITWKCETFRKGRKTVAKLRFRGKALSVCLALNSEDYAGTKYRVESLAEVKSCAPTPCMYRVKTDRRLKYAKELIAELGLTAIERENVDYAAQYPYEDTEALIEKKLVKVLTDKEAQSGTTFKPSEVREKVAASEVDKLMKDEVAANLIEKSDKAADKTKQGIINIDTLSQIFESGEKVTLDEIKKRVKGFNQKTTYIKVLARGMLDKPLTVEADAFSLQAVKMIVLTGGKAIKKR